MKELSQIIELFPISELPEDFNLLHITEDWLPGYQVRADDFILDPKPEYSEAGIIFNCDKELTIDTPDEKTIKSFPYYVSSIIRLKDTSGRNIILGSREMPARVIISPSLQKSRLLIQCKMLKSPF